MRRSIILILVILFIGCGGGGGSDRDVIPNLEGTWRGSLSLILDQCSLAVDPLAEVHELSIEGDQVTLVAQDGRTLEGSATSGEEFEVEISDGSAFPTIDRVAYSSIVDGTAQVTVSHIYSRPGGCETTWQGTMRKD